MVSYRKNSIDVRPSKSNLFWFELYVNGMFWGQHRTEKASTDFGIYIIDDAINMLSKLDNTIVINTSWKYSIKSEELINLKILTGYNDYNTILSKFDGMNLEDFINQFK